MNNLAGLSKALEVLRATQFLSLTNMKLSQCRNLMLTANFRIVNGFGNTKKINTNDIKKNVKDYSNWKTTNNEAGVITDNVDFESLLNNSKNKVGYHYSPEEDKTILDYIKLNGTSLTNFQKLALQLSRSSYKSVQCRYYRLIDDIQNQPLNAKLTWFYTPEEDKVILDYIKTNGCSSNTFRNLMMCLGHRSYSSLRCRYYKLIESKPTERKMWTLEEDEKMLEYLLNTRKEKGLKFSVNPSIEEFAKLGKILGRSSQSCYQNWHRVLLPILITHLKGLPVEMNWEWRESVRQYIKRERIKHLKDINYDNLIRGVCPGQTTYSLRYFIQQLKRNRSTRKRINDSRGLYFYEVVAENNQIFSEMSNLMANNEKRKEANLERARSVVQYYERLINSKINK